MIAALKLWFCHIKHFISSYIIDKIFSNINSFGKSLIPENYHIKTMYASFGKGSKVFEAFNKTLFLTENISTIDNLSIRKLADATLKYK